MRYEDRRLTARIADLAPGVLSAVRARVVAARLRRARRMSIIEAVCEDDSARLRLVFFNQPFMQNALTPGRELVFIGKAEPDLPRQGLRMTAPQIEEASEEGAPGVHSGRIVPVYERIGPLSGNQMRRVILDCCAAIDPAAWQETLPEKWRRALDLIPRAEAIRRVHTPGEGDDLAQLNAGRSAPHRRLILEELILFHARLALERRDQQGRAIPPRIRVDDALRARVKALLPYRLTSAQKKTVAEIVADMQKPEPMRRLLQGDVGAGKTIVALIAMVVAVENGTQAAFMTPTELLAEQHFLTLTRLMAGRGYRLALLTSGLAQAERCQTLAALADGRVQMVVGTHALIQEPVLFHRLGLAIVDEQHRFGVVQRDSLRQKGELCDLLVMTATPIPRTLALTAYGDLDLSVLDELPPGRSPIRTLHWTAGARRTLPARVALTLARGEQVYIVYPLVETSEHLEDVRAATDAAHEWQRTFPDRRVGLLHGRLERDERLMDEFARGAIAILVATTVIEVGVDVPNATLMIIEHAERFGLAQLHQLRGRVGRGRAPSSCVLMSAGRLSPEAARRLEVIASTQDGFVIAEEDLALRGPGELLGRRQWGLPEFRAADLTRDREWVEHSRAVVARSLAQGDDLESLRAACYSGAQRRALRGLSAS
jgi:ATP-dependent DNA helicase RecG